MSMSKVKALVDGAETLLKVAIEEFEAAVAKNDVVRIRDLAEKLGTPSSSPLMSCY